MEHVHNLIPDGDYDKCACGYRKKAMAARKNTTHSENTKGEIKASQLLNRLFSHANGECDMTPSQIQAAKIFIAKFKADLKAVEVSGNNENPLFMVGLPWLTQQVQKRNSA